MALYEIKEEKERVILVGVSTRENDDTEDSLDELKDLVKTAGAEAVGRVIQKRELVHPGTYVGKGKIEEIRELLWELDATGIVCDDELSPAQMNNLTDILDVKVMDRTMVILDIFAGRASTSEGKIQVELAQLKYRQSQLTGAGRAMSRLGGGIGTRGPGEKKLEMDRRLIKNRIAQLNRELREVKRHRELTREQRTKNRIPVVAIVRTKPFAGKSGYLISHRHPQHLHLYHLSAFHSNPSQYGFPTGTSENISSFTCSSKNNLISSYNLYELITLPIRSLHSHFII